MLEEGRGPDPAGRAHATRAGERGDGVDVALGIREPQAAVARAAAERVLAGAGEGTRHVRGPRVLSLRARVAAHRRLAAPAGPALRPHGRDSRQDPGLPRV